MPGLGSDAVEGGGMMGGSQAAAGLDGSTSDGMAGVGQTPQISANDTASLGSSGK